MTLSGWALVVLFCNTESICHEVIPSLWDSRQECLTEGVPPDAGLPDDVESVTYQCVYMEE